MGPRRSQAAVAAGSPVYRKRRESCPVEWEWISILRITLLCLAVRVA